MTSKSHSQKLQILHILCNAEFLVNVITFLDQKYLALIFDLDKFDVFFSVPD